MCYSEYACENVKLDSAEEFDSIKPHSKNDECWQRAL